MLLKLLWGSVQRLSVGRLSHQCAKLTKSLLGLKAILYMVIEYFNAGAAVEIYRCARNRGRQLPPGLEYVDSWVDLDYFRCFQLMRAIWDFVHHYNASLRSLPLLFMTTKKP